ncbi:AEC family transporter [Tahibacter soli]|uniref:AEC family transporter n=1 Tax=Tahibacter soli TaxID=2983605 RepID=A0A9X3YME8_9GAMM|nr:AEC family transporter [Tahibacter soli]MDC8014327.1 AEC family transporter [Tahibacter soli]
MSVTASFAFVLLLIALGRLLAWRRIVPENASDALNAVVLYVCLPASILINAPKLEFRAEILAVAAVPWLLLAASTVLVLAVARALKFARGDTAVLLLEVPLGNTSFLGFALIPVLAGAEALRYAVVFDQFGSFFILSTFGLTVIALYGGGAKPTPATIARRIVGFPPFLTLVFALTLMPKEPPPAVATMLASLSGALLPLVGLALGMQLKLKLPRSHLAPLAVGLVGKLVVLPALALLLAGLLGLDATMRAAVVLEAAMPPMITAAALAAMAGLAPELGAALVGYGILASTITLPLWRMVL